MCPPGFGLQQNLSPTLPPKNRSDLVKTICCMTVDETMTEEQMRPKFERVLQGQDLYGNTVMHYFALRKNDVAIAELLRVGGCMCIRNYAGQNAMDVRKTEELHMLSSELPGCGSCVQSISHTYHAH